MLTLIIGGSGSGKSDYAEMTAAALSPIEQKYYIATMRVFGEEGRKKVEKHRLARADKNFMTIEQPRDVQKALERISEPQGTALVECMSNLVANEMFLDGAMASEEAVVQKILTDIDQLLLGVRHLVIDSNNVFEDGIRYDEATMSYLRVLGKMNQLLAAKADAVTEVVVGIPVPIKGGLL